MVDVENILRRLKENAEKATPLPVLTVIAAASQEVRSGIVYATMIVVLVFIPLFALSGIEGRLFTPLGIAYIVSILASLVTSITVTPVLSYYLLGRTRIREHKDGWLVRHLKAGNRRLLLWAFDRPKTLSPPSRWASWWLRPAAVQLPRLFLPPFNEGTLLINVQYNPGISLAESDRSAPSPRGW